MALKLRARLQEKGYSRQDPDAETVDLKTLETIQGSTRGTKTTECLNNVQRGLLAWLISSEAAQSHRGPLHSGMLVGSRDWSC